MDRIVEIENLSVRRDQPILEDISWQIESGEHWCMLGPNGSGKSTLLGVLTAYISPTSGRIRICGKEYGKYDWREMRKRIGFVSSVISQRMNRPLSAIEIITSGKSARLNVHEDMREDPNGSAMQMLEQVEGEHLADRSWLKLSQGERQRVLIGRVLFSDPEILILDEPCAGLDPVARERFLLFIERLIQQNNAPTILFVTHHVEEITPSFSHVLLLKDGSVLESGEKQEVLQSESLSAAFNAEITLNQYDGRYNLSFENGSL